jgi:hypothetical protein
VGAGGFEGEFALGNRQPFRAIKFTGTRSVFHQIADFAMDAFKRFLPGFGVEAGVDFEGARFIEERDIAADLVAEPAILTEFADAIRRVGANSRKDNAELARRGT